MAKQQSIEQQRFLEDLLKDLERLFHAARPGRTEKDFAAWMGGTLNRQAASEEAGFFETKEAVCTFLSNLTSFQARRTIGALMAVRKREEAGLGREGIITCPPQLRAIWTLLRRHGKDADAAKEIVNAVTAGATTSTKHLRREEANEVIRRLGGETTIFEVTPPTRPGGKSGTRPRRRTVV